MYSGQVDAIRKNDSHSVRLCRRLESNLLTTLFRYEDAKGTTLEPLMDRLTISILHLFVFPDHAGV